MSIRKKHVRPSRAARFAAIRTAQSAQKLAEMLNVTLQTAYAYRRKDGAFMVAKGETLPEWGKGSDDESLEDAYAKSLGGVGTSPSDEWENQPLTGEESPTAEGELESDLSA